MPEEGNTQPNLTPAAPVAPTPTMPAIDTPTPAPTAPVTPDPVAPTVSQATQDGTSTQNAAVGEFDPKDITDSKGIIWLSYCGIFSLIPYFTQKENRYTHKHAIQGLNMFIFTAIVSAGVGILDVILTMIALSSFSLLWMASIPAIINTAFGAFSCFISVISIIGIVNAESGKYQDLPLVSKIKIIKK